MEKMPLPKFDGNSRHYPRFLKDFTELVLPNIDTRESAYTLRQCLTKEVNDKLGSCDDDCDNMLKRLDVKYGDPSKIMESIVSDVHKFKRLDSDDHLKIIEFINMLERAHGDLKALGLKTEIANANTISTIENKLPKPIQMDWHREIYKENSLVDKKAKFPHLLKFLCTERDALEYSTSELRKFARPQSFNVHANNTAVDNQCLIHFWSDNHQTSECRTYSTLSLDNKFKVIKEKFSCYGCLSVGHVLKECTSKSICGNAGCKEYHHPSLHNVEISGLSHSISDNRYAGRKETRIVTHHESRCTYPFL